MKPSKTGIVTPKPFFEISFGCGNRAFYGVKSDLYDIANKIGIEIQDGYISESCDYEGDLDEILIYNNERGKSLIAGILDFYVISKDDVPENMPIRLTL